jgi:hypothetical protein
MISCRMRIMSLMMSTSCRDLWPKWLTWRWSRVAWGSCPAHEARRPGSWTGGGSPTVYIQYIIINISYLHIYNLNYLMHNTVKLLLFFQNTVDKFCASYFKFRETKKFKFTKFWKVLNPSLLSFQVCWIWRRHKYYINSTVYCQVKIYVCVRAFSLKVSWY